MNENSRCSILFHLLVAGGEWQPGMPTPSSSASSCRCSFQVRDRLLLLPPASAQIRIRLAPCFLWRPASFHHRRMLSTANSAVSCVTPTLTTARSSPISYAPVHTQRVCQIKLMDLRQIILKVTLHFLVWSGRVFTNSRVLFCSRARNF